MMTKNSKKYDGEICEFGEFSYYKFHIDVYHRYNIEAMRKANNADDSFKLINSLTDQNKQVLDDEYVYSVLEKIRELGSGEEFLMLAKARVNIARYELLGDPLNRPKAVTKKGVLYELCPDELAQHVIPCGCTGTGYPCIYSNGPCCCTVQVNGIGDCPFGEGAQSFDEDYARERLEKLRSLDPDDKEALSSAEKNIALARKLVKENEKRINSSIKA